MPKSLTYSIQPNHLLWEKFKTNTRKGFKDPSFSWKPFQLVNTFWDEFDHGTFYNYNDLANKVSLITDDLLSTPCDYHREKHFFFSSMLYQLQVGQTLFVKYE